MTTETSTSEPLTPDGTARQFADDGGIPTWEARFRAPTIGFPTWSRHAPDHIVYASTESGRWQLHAWDLAANTRRRVTDEPVGVTAGSVTAEGEGVVWLRDESGDESGRFVVARVDGGGAEPLADELPRGWDGGLALGRERSIVGVSDAEGVAVYGVARRGPPPGPAPPRGSGSTRSTGTATRTSCTGTSSRCPSPAGTACPPDRTSRPGS